MFHVEHLAQILDLSGFLARGRQWQSEVSIRLCYLRQNMCKSDRCQVFFAGVGKIFSQTCSLRARPRAHPGSIRAISAKVKDYLRQGPG